MTLSGEQLAVLLDGLPDIVLVLDANGRVQWGNPTAERFWGRSLDSAVGTSALDLIHRDDVEFVLRSLESIQAKSVGELIELRTFTPSGWRLVEVIGRPVGKIGEIGQDCIVLCIRDVTERRRFEVAHGDVEKFRSILHNSAYVAMLVTKDRLIESVSATLTRLLGHDPEAVEGSPLVELFDTTSREDIDRAFDTAEAGEVSTGPVTIAASCLEYGSGRVVPVELTIVSLADDPTMSGFVVSMRDLSELVRVEREVREALSLLTAALESTADGLLVVDNEGRIVSYNQHFAEMWRIPPELLETRDNEAALAFVMGQLIDANAFIEDVRTSRADPGSERSDTLSFLDGRTLERYAQPQRLGDEIVGRVVSFRDVSERVRLERALEADHRRLAEAQEVARLGMFEMNIPDGSIYWSAAYRVLIGATLDEPPSIERFLETVHPDDKPSIQAAMKEAFDRNDGSFEANCCVVLPDGELRWLQMRTRGMFDANGALVKVLGTAIDVTDKRANEAARREAEEQFRLGYEHSAVPSAMLDLDGNITSVNPVLIDFFAYSAEQLIGRSAVEFVHPDDRDYFATRARVSRGDKTPMERRFIKADGSIVFGLINMALVTRDDGSPAYVYAQVQDITERKRFEQALEHMALHDPLTGLPNRALLQDRLESALARSGRQSTRVAVIFADIDRFKLVNDTLGHAAGDRLLVDLAERLKKLTRASDTVGRFGGDEFRDDL